MTTIQKALLAFAARHDWGFDAVVDGQGVRVGCDAHNVATGWTREYTTVYTLAELRDWAGY